MEDFATTLVNLLDQSMIVHFQLQDGDRDFVEKLSLPVNKPRTTVVPTSTKCLTYHPRVHKMTDRILY
uniref:Transposase n=1 Tax=Heterorhabditis bacteriophora TaxID=37862 RepID=A0A1I7WGQ2_HETBA